MLMEMEMLQGKPPGHLQAEAFLTTFFFFIIWVLRPVKIIPLILSPLKQTGERWQTM